MSLWPKIKPKRSCSSRVFRIILWVFLLTKELCDCLGHWRSFLFFCFSFLALSILSIFLLFNFLHLFCCSPFYFAHTKFAYFPCLCLVVQHPEKGRGRWKDDGRHGWFGWIDLTFLVEIPYHWHGLKSLVVSCCPVLILLSSAFSSCHSRSWDVLRQSNHIYLGIFSKFKTNFCY